MNPAHSNVRAYDVGLVLSSPTRTKSPNLSELSPSLIISRAFPPISSTVLPVPYAKKCTSAKRAADWVIVSANTLGMLRLTIKTLLNQSRDFSTSSSRTILKKHMVVCGLSFHLGNTESRKNIKQKFIFQIGTLRPCEPTTVFHSSNLAPLFYRLFLLIT